MLYITENRDQVEKDPSNLGWDAESLTRQTDRGKRELGHHPAHPRSPACNMDGRKRSARDFRLHLGMQQQFVLEQEVARLSLHASGILHSGLGTPFPNLKASKSQKDMQKRSETRGTKS